jgi:hypothetical protein
MEATRRRFGSIVEWFCAASCAAGAVGMLSLAIHDVRSVRPVVPVIAEEALDAASPAGIPPGVVRVPLLLLPDRREVRVGAQLTDVVAHLGAAARLVSESFEDTKAGRRITRFYDDVGVQFVLVFDGAGVADDARLSAIFVR